MTVSIVVARERDGAPRWTVSIAMAGALLADRSIPACVDDEGRWWPAPAQDDDAGLADLSDRLADRSATPDEICRYGKALFDALLGEAVWTAIRKRADPGGILEFRLAWPAGDGALHRMIWELMHDGSGYLALRDDLPVVVLREVPDSAATNVGDKPISTIPRVLFAVGSRLTDPQVRPGAEFMGVLRALQRNGGAIRQRVVTEASLDRIAASCEGFLPQIVHLIGHGRWDAQASHAVLELRSDENPTRTAEVTASEILGALARNSPLPVAAVVNACETGVAFSEGGAPFAATLVEGGVPIVIAMAGDVADTACRVFSRSVAAAVSDGLPLSWAVREGRRAAFRRGLTDLNPLDWALPALFVTPHLPDGFTLVDTTRSQVVRTGVCQLGFDWAPVFCGRDEFFDDLDRLLDPGDGLAVVAAYSEVEAEYGGTRLLRELAGATLRAGHLPCMVGPFQQGQAPTTVRRLALRITECVLKLRKILGIDAGWTSETLGALADDAGKPADKSPAQVIAMLNREAGDDVPVGMVVDPLRADLFALAADAAAKGGLFGAGTRPLLLLDDVHLYDRALDALVDNDVFGTRGFGDGAEMLPAVLFGKQAVANGARLAEADARYRGATWWRCRSVQHFRDIAARNGSDEDVLAYQWWLLNPEPNLGGLGQVLAPRRIADNPWADVARTVMLDSRQVYDGELLGRIAALGLQKKWFSGSDDDAILRAYGIMR
ncbi:MAG TPA: CHAT domain-containing protein [Actinoplanes sp.]|nr:CHAT domain-containing protein [Actinoplanes sp.]